MRKNWSKRKKIDFCNSQMNHMGKLLRQFFLRQRKTLRFSGESGAFPVTVSVFECGQDQNRRFTAIPVRKAKIMMKAR